MSRNYSELIVKDGPFSHDPESLRTFECPQWFRDAKFAIWSHWGPQSVPMFGDWYARHIYKEGSDQYRHHWRVYGHPSKVGYKDIAPLWKAEHFDPHELMDLFVRAGSAYFVAQAMHHDNFDNFNSEHQPRFNSCVMGPMKDIVGLWQEAARARGLRFGVTEHLGASFTWWGENKGADKEGPYAGVPYDGVDPAYRDLYYDNAGVSLDKGDPWLTTNDAFQRHWFHRIKDLIDKYQPDLLYSDSDAPFGEVGRRIIAHLYNTSAGVHGANDAVYTQKSTDPDIYRYGVLDIERGQRDDISPDPWQTDTSVGDWFYNVKDVYKTAPVVLETLVDIVSKNGNLCLNVPQRPDGTLDDECRYLLEQMAGWMSVNAEAVFGTRPWIVSGEGAAAAAGGAFKETAVEWTDADYRFTQKPGVVYAFQMRWPGSGTAAIRSFAAGSGPKVTQVSVLGIGDAGFEQGPGGLSVRLPDWQARPVGPHVLRLGIEG